MSHHEPSKSTSTAGESICSVAFSRIVAKMDLILRSVSRVAITFCAPSHLSGKNFVINRFAVIANSSPSVMGSYSRWCVCISYLVFIVLEFYHVCQKKLAVRGAVKVAMRRDYRHQVVVILHTRHSNLARDETRRAVIMVTNQPTHVAGWLAHVFRLYRKIYAPILSPCFALFDYANMSLFGRGAPVFFTVTSCVSRFCSPSFPFQSLRDPRPPQTCKITLLLSQNRR